MRRVGSTLLLVTAFLAGDAAGAAAEVQEAGDGSALRHWWERMNADVEELIAARQVVPPTPVKLRWHPRRVWSGALPGDLLDLEVTDLGADGQDELLALTTESIIVLSRRRGLFDVRTQVPLPDRPSSTRSRDAIGGLAIGGGALPAADGETYLRARSSEQGAGGLYAWRNGALESVSEFIGYPLCETGTMDAVAGRNFFAGRTVSWPNDDGPALGPQFYSARCSRDMVDPTGVGVRYVSAVSIGGELSVHCEGAADVCDPAPTTYADVGYAHLVVDLDNDGRAEVVTTSSTPRGDRDRVQVFSQGDGTRRLLFEREFERGIVALEAGDFDGDGALELLAAERQPKPGRVSLWLLN